MSLFFSLLTLLNFLAFLYLFFLISKKYRSFNSDNSKDSNAIQKINLLRFNPFDDVGGDQSFVLTLLDKDNSGVLLTSLHHRSFTRL